MCLNSGGNGAVKAIHFFFAEMKCPKATTRYTL